jgi:cell division protein FtsB
VRTQWLALAAIALVMVLAVVDQKSGLSTWMRLRGELDASQQRIRVLEGANDALRDEIRALERDPFAVERAIREDLELARPGEIVVRFGRGPS